MMNAATRHNLEKRRRARAQEAMLGRILYYSLVTAAYLACAACVALSAGMIGQSL